MTAGLGSDSGTPTVHTFLESELLEFASNIKKEREGVWPGLNGAAASAPALDAYNTCINQMTHNVLGPRVALGKEMNVKALREISTSHPDDEWIVNCIEYGFSLQYRGPPINNIF